MHRQQTKWYWALTTLIALGVIIGIIFELIDRQRDHELHVQQLNVQRDLSLVIERVKSARVALDRDTYLVAMRLKAAQANELKRKCDELERERKRDKQALALERQRADELAARLKESRRMYRATREEVAPLLGKLEAVTKRLRWSRVIMGRFVHRLAVAHGYSAEEIRTVRYTPKRRMRNVVPAHGGERVLQLDRADEPMQTARIMPPEAHIAPTAKTPEYRESAPAFGRISTETQSVNALAKTQAVPDQDELSSQTFERNAPTYAKSVPAVHSFTHGRTVRDAFGKDDAHRILRPLLAARPFKCLTRSDSRCMLARSAVSQILEKRLNNERETKRKHHIRLRDRQWEQFADQRAGPSVDTPTILVPRAIFEQTKTTLTTHRLARRRFCRSEPCRSSSPKTVGDAPYVPNKWPYRLPIPTIL